MNRLYSVLGIVIVCVLTTVFSYGVSKAFDKSVASAVMNLAFTIDAIGVVICIIVALGGGSKSP